MATSPKLSIQLLASGQQPDITTNEAIVFLEALSNLSFVTFDQNGPPGSPSDGDTHFTGTSATGAWIGQNSKIAIYYSGWRFFTAVQGLTAYDETANEYIAYSDDGSEWHPLQARWSTTEYWTGEYRTPINNSGGTAKKYYAKVIEASNLTGGVPLPVVFSPTLAIDMSYPVEVVLGSINDTTNNVAVSMNSTYFSTFSFIGTSVARSGSDTFILFDPFGPAFNGTVDADVLVRYCKAGA